jgi:ABC-2 type transport system ATP-binding protein
MGSVLIAQNINSKYVSSFNHNFIEKKIYAIISDDRVVSNNLLKILSNQEKRYTGEVFLDGVNIKKTSKINDICYISPDHEFLPNITVNRILKSMKNKYPKWDVVLAFKMLEQANIQKRKMFKKLSIPEKNTLIGIITHASCANVTIYEDPFEYAITKVRYLLLNELYMHHIKYKRCIILMTNRLSEISRYIDKVVFLHQGLILESFTPSYIDNNFITLTGKKEVLASLLYNKTLKGQVIGLEEKELANTNDKENELTAYLSASYTKDDIRFCQKYEIMISKMYYEKLFIFLSLIKERKNAEKTENILHKEE